MVAFTKSCTGVVAALIAIAVIPPSAIAQRCSVNSTVICDGPYRNKFARPENATYDYVVIGAYSLAI